MTVFKRAALRRPVHRRLAVVGVAAAGVLLLAACSDDSGSMDGMNGMDHGSSSSAPAQPQGAGESSASGAFNDADVTFAQQMIPHHQQAVEMAELVDGRASDPEIKTLAEQIEKAQGPEIKTLQSWLKSWDKPQSSSSMPGMDHGASGADDGGMGGMDHGSGGTDDGSGMSGMMSDEDMAKLMDAKGTDFDRMFAEMMIAHHKSAIEMAKDEQRSGRNADAKELAAEIVKGQSAEVEKFQEILDRL